MSNSQEVEQTVLVFYRVRVGERLHHFQASFLRAAYRGARPGSDLVRQMEHVGYVCAIEPGARVRTVHEVRTPCKSHEEVEAEVLRYLAEQHGTSPDRIEEIARHVFEAS